MYPSLASSSDSKKSDSTDDSNNAHSSSPVCFKKNTSKYSPGSRLTKSENNSCCTSCHSDSSVSDGKIINVRRRGKRGCRKTLSLPPLGVFWDIENCQVPKYKSAASVVQRIRERFLQNYRETEFLVVCDVKKENALILQDLHDAQVNLIHVSSTSKNAADEKLRQSLRRFAEIFEAPSAVVLISGDINFAADLYDLRYRKKIHVILVHNTNTADALILCANENYVYSDIMENLPALKKDKQYTGNHPVDLLIYNLPTNCDIGKIKVRLGHLTDNCGGRVQNVICERGVATIRFTSMDFAIRAQRRIQGEDVFGNKVKVLNPSASSTRDATLKTYTGSRANKSTFHKTQLHTPSPGGYGFQNNASANNGVQEKQNRRRRNSTSMSDFDSNVPNQGSFNRRNYTLEEGACALPLMPFHNAQLSTRSEAMDDFKMHFSEGDNFSNDSSMDSSVDLVIYNLDHNTTVKDLRKLFKNVLGGYVRISNLSITNQHDGLPIANLRVASQHEAMFTISQLHRQKFNFRKHLMISYPQKNSRDLSKLRALVMLILQGTTNFSMHTLLLVNILQETYNMKAAMSDIIKLQDVCTVVGNGTTVMLNQEFRVTPDVNLRKVMILNHCDIHRPENVENKGWAEITKTDIFYVNISLKKFVEKVYNLLHIHNGSMLLLSFPVCYEMVFNEPLPLDNNGVPLEHLLSCIKNIELKYNGPVKTITFKHCKNNIDFDKDNVSQKFPPSLKSNISLLCEELVHLLKIFDHCQISINRFIPAYHQHFGRQLRVADFGYLKLDDLLESLPQVLQIIGEGSNRILTLSHEIQMRRFSTDLLKILRAQSSKQISMKEFPLAYEKLNKKQFKPVEYGLCDLNDLLDEIPENVFVFTKIDDDVVVSLPKRKQTPVELEKTKQFASEVEELLYNSPHCSMLISKFVPTYHHRFKHQCKVSDYGVTKLIDLFEAIPETVIVEELPNGERWIRLTQQKALEFLKTQITSLIMDSESSSLLFQTLPSLYLSQYGYPLKPEFYGCHNVTELITKLNDTIEVIRSNAGQLLVCIDKTIKPSFAVQVWAVLLNPPHAMNLNSFINEFHKLFSQTIPLTALHQLENVVIVYQQDDEVFISLTHLYIFAAQLYKILYNAGGQTSFDSLEKIYLNTYNKTFDLPNYDVHSMDTFASQFDFMIKVEKTKDKCVIRLNKQLEDFKIPLPAFGAHSNANAADTLLQWPPTPMFYDLPKNVQKSCPPKPDTPPADGSLPWSPPSSSLNPNFQIDLPVLSANDFDYLLSPISSFLPANLFSPSCTPMIAAPDSTNLPLPDKLLNSATANICDDLNDSGMVSQGKILNSSPSDSEGYGIENGRNVCFRDVSNFLSKTNPKNTYKN